MKKLVLSLSFIIVFAFYAFWSTSRTASLAIAVPPTSTNLNTSPIPSTSPNISTSPTTIISVPSSPSKSPATVPVIPKTPVATMPSPVATTNSGKYKNGTYTGPATDVYYGNIQVKATIAGGKLTDVTFLQYPSDRRTSQQKSAMAMPILKSEAIQAQSANVNAVSQATETSKGFVASLGAALAQAAN